jgi:hypothetical protein
MNDKSHKQDYVSRGQVLKLLSDDEVGRVSTAESARRLEHGAEYVDLDDLRRGVQRMDGAVGPIMSHILPRVAVSDETWKRICARLGASPSGPGKTT